MNGMNGGWLSVLRGSALLGLFTGVGLLSCSSDEDTNAGAAGAAGSAACLPGLVICRGNVADSCDGTKPVDCAEQNKVCADRLGCVACQPEQGSCQNGVATWCRPDGSAIETFECDPAQGMVCEADGCKGACALPELAHTYLGCDYYPTQTVNPVWSGFDFAVAIANAGTQATSLLITRGSETVHQSSLEPGAVNIVPLPWVPELKGGDADACQQPPDAGATRLVSSGAYRVRTDQPVTVYQFNPLRYQISPTPEACPVGALCPGSVAGYEDCLSFSNDASLLLPRTALTSNYLVASWPSTAGRASFVAVTAVDDETDVTLSGVGTVIPGAGIAETGGTVRLNRGDVLQVLGAMPEDPQGFGGDLTGARVKATKPVQVIGGHSCANVPEPRTGECDHIEHAMLPIETLGRDYLVSFPAALASESPHVIRIQALEPGTTVQFDPPEVHPRTTIGPNTLELRDVAADFRVTADKPLLVTQYMQGQTSVPSGSGDPSMALVVPTAQFRKEYLFVASSTFDTNFVNVTAPVGVSVQLDGQILPAEAFTPIGGSGFGVARHELDRAEVHTITSSQPFGINVYGYGRFTSYMYVGGMDLQRITPPPVE